MLHARHVLENIRAILPSSFTWVEQRDMTWQGEWQTGGHEYAITLSELLSKPGVWEAGFIMRDTRRIRGWATNVTGTGNAQAVLSVVVAAIREFLATVQPATLSFVGQGRGRGRVYARLARTLATTGGYDVTTQESSAGIVVTLTRQD